MANMMNYSGSGSIATGTSKWCTNTTGAGQGAPYSFILESAGFFAVFDSKPMPYFLSTKSTTTTYTAPYLLTLTDQGTLDITDNNKTVVTSTPALGSVPAAFGYGLGL